MSTSDLAAGTVSSVTEAQEIAIKVGLTLQAVEHKIAVVWSMAEVYLQQRDSHGIMDMGAELQALERTLRTLSGLTL